MAVMIKYPPLGETAKDRAHGGNFPLINIVSDTNYEKSLFGFNSNIISWMFGVNPIIQD